MHLFVIVPTGFYKPHLAALIHFDGIVDETFFTTVTAGEVTFEDVRKSLISCVLVRFFIHQ